MRASGSAGRHREQEAGQKYSWIAWVCCEPLTQTDNGYLGRRIRDPMKEKRPCRPMERFRPLDPDLNVIISCHLVLWGQSQERSKTEGGDAFRSFNL